MALTMTSRDELTRGGRNVKWVEKFCNFIDGPYRGRFVYLTAAERETIFRL
jgi:hypothetical protein